MSMYLNICQIGTKKSEFPLSHLHSNPHILLFSIREAGCGCWTLWKESGRSATRKKTSQVRCHVNLKSTWQSFTYHLWLIPSLFFFFLFKLLLLYINFTLLKHKNIVYQTNIWLEYSNIWLEYFCTIWEAGRYMGSLQLKYFVAPQILSWNSSFGVLFFFFF